jgi:hypothetical protein
MPRKPKRSVIRGDLPESFSSVAEAAAFWDEHDSMDFEDQMIDTEFTVDIKQRRYLVPIAGGVLEAVQVEARSQGISTETLVNLLLKEHLERREQD